MFLNYHTTSGLIIIITLLLAYCLVITVSQVFKAWVARTLGDPTATQQGFSSWNPLDHADFVGVACLLVLGLGWGRRVPITREYISGPWRMAKILLAYFSDVFAYIMLGIGSVLALTLIFEGSTLGLGAHDAMSDILNFHTLQALHPSLSSTKIALGLVALSTLFMSIMLGSIQVVINGFNYLVDRYYNQIVTSGMPVFVWWILPTIVMIMSIGFIQWFMVSAILKLSALSAQFLALF